MRFRSPRTPPHSDQSSTDAARLRPPTDGAKAYETAVSLSVVSQSIAVRSDGLRRVATIGSSMGYAARLAIVSACMFATIANAVDVGKDKCQLKPVDIVFVLDSSNSIWAPDWNTMVSFIQRLVSGFNTAPDKTRVGLMIFTDYPTVVWTLQEKTSRAELLRAFGNISQQEGNTNSAGALRFMRQKMFSETWGARKGVAKICFFLTDGKSDFTKATLREAMLVHTLTDVQVIAIGIGQEVDLEELVAIASKPLSGNPLDKNWYSLEDMQQLNNQLKTELSIKACEVEAGRTESDRIRSPENAVAKDGTWSVCSRQAPADVMFVFDPFSLGRVNTKKAVSLFKDIVSQLPIGKDKYRVGFIPEAACSDDADGRAVNSSSAKGPATALRNVEDTLFSIIDGLGLRRQKLASYVEIARQRHLKGVPGMRSSRRRIAVVLVDENQDVPRIALESRKLLIQGGDVIAIGVGRDVTTSDLQNIASDPRLAYRADDMGSAVISSLQGDVLRGLCAVYTKANNLHTL